MKTKFRNVVSALVLAVAALGISASELERLTMVEVESAMDMECWMLDEDYFEVNKDEVITGTVVEIAVANPNFSILVEAVTKAGLVEALSADGPFTVFVPTNDAFNNLFEQLEVKGIEDLSAEQLTPILTYHVVGSKVMSSDLSNTSVTTLNGQEIDIDLNDGVKVNKSKVLTADISGENGVIHVIDRVLIPEAKAKKSSGCSN